MRLHGSSLPSSDNAATINSLLTTCTSSSMKAKPIMVSSRYNRWQRIVSRATLATASLIVFYWTSCCNNSKSCRGAKSADGPGEPCLQVDFDYENNDLSKS